MATITDTLPPVAASSNSAQTKEPAFPLPRLLTLPSSTSPELITQGAEGRLYKSTYLLPTIPCALKHRPSKPWRHPVLDARLTRHRILSEARILTKCRREGVPVPAVYAVDLSDELSASAVATGARVSTAAAAPQTTSVPAGPAKSSHEQEDQKQQPTHATGGGCLTLEWIQGEPVRKPINEYLKRRRESERKAGRAGDAPVTGDLPEDADLVDMMRRIGAAVGRLHKVGVIHGDLTTSNMMLRHLRGDSSSSSSSFTTTANASPPTSSNKRKHEDSSIPTTTTIVEDNTAASEPSAAPPSTTSILEGEIVIIDFGLAAQGSADEDRAVDLYVLERAFASTHPRAEGLFRVVLEQYEKQFKGAGIVLKRLEDVRMRGRKRSMIG